MLKIQVLERLDVVLDHGIYCTPEECHCQSFSGEFSAQQRDGGVAISEVKKKVAGSMTLLKGEVKILPNAFAKLPQVKRALTVDPPKLRILATDL